MADHLTEGAGRRREPFDIIKSLDKVIDMADGGDILAHRILMLAMRCPLDFDSTPWDKATRAAAVEWLGEAVDHVMRDLKTDSTLWLLQNAPAKLMDNIDLQLQVIEAAEAGDHVAHSCLTKLYWSMVNVGKTPPVVVAAYCARANLRPPPRRRRGRYTLHKHLHRDKSLMALIVLACLRFAVSPTRNHTTKLTGTPSGASLVAPAVRRRGVRIKESTLANMWSAGGGARGVATIQECIAHIAKNPASPVT